MAYFTITIAVYNGQDFIAQAVESVLAQTFDDFELIVVNDGSKDQTKDILSRYESHDKVTVISKENSGLGITRNTGLAHAKGKYIHFMDSDDWLHPHFLEAAYGVVSRQKPDVLVGTHIGVWHNDRDVTPVYLPESLSRTPRPFTWKERPEVLMLPTPVWDKMYRRQFLIDQNISFIRTNCEDIPFRWQTLVDAKKISVLPTPYYFYRNREGSLTGGLRLAQEVFLAIEASFRFLEQHKDMEELSEVFFGRTVVEIVYPLSKARQAFLSNESVFENYLKMAKEYFLRFDEPVREALFARHPELRDTLYEMIMSDASIDQKKRAYRTMRGQSKAKMNSWQVYVDPSYLRNVLGYLKRQFQRG